MCRPYCVGPFVLSKHPCRFLNPAGPPYRNGRDRTLLGALLSLSLAASPATAVLHYRTDGTPSCPNEGWLIGDVSGRLGYQPFQPEAPITVEISVQCTRSGCTAQLSLLKAGAPPRVRTLNAGPGQCRELMESVALALALAVDPQLLSRPATLPPVEAPPAPKPVPPLPAPPPVVHFHALVGGQGVIGLSPQPSFGGLLGLGFQRDWYSLTLEGRVDAIQSVTVPNGTLRSLVMLGSLLPCGNFRGLGVCVDVSAGALQVEGALSGGRRITTPLVLLGGRVQYQHSFLPWLAARAHLDVQAVLSRTTVIVAGEPVWTTGQLSGDLGLAFVAVF